MIIELKRGHWIFFSLLLAAQFGGLWTTLTRIPDRESIFRLLQQLPWLLRVDIIGGMVGLCFLTTIVVGQLFRAVQSGR